MKDLFLPYELALLARKKIFNEECLGYYCSKDREVYIGNIDVLPPFNFDIKSKVIINAPLYQQMVDWLREKHNLHITVIPLGSFLKKKTITMYDVYVNNNYMYADINLDAKGDGIPEFKTYYDALNKGIEIALNSIEI